MHDNSQHVVIITADVVLLAQEQPQQYEEGRIESCFHLPVSEFIQRLVSELSCSLYELQCLNVN